MLKAADFRAFCEDSPDICWQTDAKGRYVYVSRAVRDLLGYEPAELIGRSPTDFMPPEDAGRVGAAFAAAIAKRAHLEALEHRALKKGGGIVWLECAGRPVLGPRGRLLGYRGTDREATRRVDDRLRVGNAVTFFRSSIQNLDSGMLIETADRRVVEVNRAFCALFCPGVPPEKLAGVDCLEAAARAAASTVHGKDFVARIETIVAGRRRILGEPVVMLDGRVLERDYLPVIDSDGRLVGHIWQYRDVTEKRRRDEDLKQAHRFLDTIIENLPHMIFVKEAKSLRFVRFNKAGEDLLGLPRASLIGKNDFDFFPEDQARFFTTKDRAVLAGKAVLDIPEEAIETRDKGVRWLHTKKIPILDEAGRPLYLLGISEDITDRRSAEEQLRDSQRLESIGRLAGGVAHEFNNILTGIRGLAQLALEDLGKDHHSSDDMRRIDEVCRRGADLVTQLLTFSRKRPPRSAPVDVNSIIRRMQKMLRASVGADIDLEVALSPETPPIMADTAQLEQTLLNLCLNARDAFEGRGTVRVETVLAELEAPLETMVGTAHPGRYALLRVSDDGCGMPEDLQRRIFEPFFTTKAPGRGTGLGLSVVYAVVAQHGGHICLQSRPGGGTTFELLFPEAREAPVETAVDAPPPDDSGHETILVAEDDPVPRDVIVRALTRRGYSVLVAKDGHHAVEIFRENAERIHLVLLDVVMPRVGGLEAREAIAELRPDVPIVLMTGYTEQPLAESPKGPLLLKPFSTTELGRRVREVLDAR